MKKLLSTLFLLQFFYSVFGTNDSIFVHKYEILYDQNQIYIDNDEVKIKFILRANNPITYNNLDFNLSFIQGSPYISSKIFSIDKTSLDFVSKTYDTVVTTVKILPEFPMKTGSNTLVVWPIIKLNGSQEGQLKTGESNSKLYYVTKNKSEFVFKRSIRKCINGKEISLSNIPSGINKISIYNITGTLVKEINVNSSFEKFQLNHSGIYIITYQSSDLIESEKIVIR